MKKYMFLLLLLVPFSVYAWGYEITDGDLNTVGSTVKIADEEFYVMGKEDDTHIKLLAKNNLKVGSIYEDNVKKSEYTPSDPGYGLQVKDEQAGTMAFSSSRYWWDADNVRVKDGYGPTVEFQYHSESATYIYDENSNLYPIVNNYADYLNGQGVCVKGTLISREDLLGLGCIDSCIFCNYTAMLCFNAYQWVTQSKYWTGTSWVGHVSSSLPLNSNVVSMASDSVAYTYNPDYDSYIGVRPVITLDTKCDKKQPTKKEEVKGKTEEVKENPKTGVFGHALYILVFAGLALFIYYKTSKKSYFK